MNTVAWEYFGRRNADNEVTEIYRMPAGSMHPADRLAAKQRLRQGMFWLDAGDDVGLNNDWLSGWFDFQEDRLTDAEAGELIRDWATRDVWPGRP